MTITRADLEPGTIYRLRSRNLAYGVYDGRGGFIGIRTKFQARYLFTEYLRDDPEYLGFDTATPLEPIGRVPADIPLLEGLGARDRNTGRPVAFDRPVGRGGRGWYFTDTNEPDQTIHAYEVANTALFDLLDSLPVAYADD